MKVAAAPDSLVTRPATSVTVMPARRPAAVDDERARAGGEAGPFVSCTLKVKLAAGARHARYRGEDERAELRGDDHLPRGHVRPAELQRRARQQRSPSIRTALGLVRRHQRR
ncbi:MAG: hypothetical protein U1F45_02065 [Burkholderiales bacterium]